MAVLATFDPGNDSYGRSANALISGLEAGQSLMERKQRMALAQQQEDRQRMEFIAKLPLIQAQAELTQESARSAVATGTIITKLQAQAAAKSPEYTARFNEILKNPDWATRANDLEQFQGEVSWMSGLKDTGGDGFVTAVGKAREQAEGMTLANTKLQEQKEQLSLKAGFQVALQDQKAELAKTLADERNKALQEKMTLISERDEAKREATGNVAYSKKRGEAQAAVVADVESRVQQHYATLDQTARARSLIDQDAEQGRGRATVLGVQQAVNSFLPGTFDTTKEEALKNSYAEMALAAAAKMKGQGSITEAERSLLAESTAKFGNSPQAAKYIMDFMDAVAKREIARAEYYSELEGDGQMVTSKRTTDFYRQNPISKFLTSEITQSQPAINPAQPLVIKSIRRLE